MIPDINKHGSISIFLFLLKIMVKIEKQIAAKRASMFPHNAPINKTPQNITNTPPNAKIIVKIVIIANFSLRIKKEKKAVRKGIRLIVKTVFATVVDVIDKMKHMFDKLNTIPPRSP